MERFEVRRGVAKSLGGNAGLEKLATKYFEQVSAGIDGGFNASFGILTNITANYSDDGKLVVDVKQMKGQELQSLLHSDDGREKAMASRTRWSSFLDAATGYDAKKRGDKAKEAAKKVSKAKGNIRQAQKFMSMSSSLDEQTLEQAADLIMQVEKKLEEGNGTRALSLSKQLNKLIEG